MRIKKFKHLGELLENEFLLNLIILIVEKNLQVN